MVSMNRLDSSKRAQVILALVEGNSLRSTSRMLGVAINTVVKLTVDAGAACSDYQDKVMQDLKCQRMQIDEIWSFCYAKAKNATPEIAAKNPHAGDTWTKRFDVLLQWLLAWTIAFGRSRTSWR